VSSKAEQKFFITSCLPCSVRSSIPPQPCHTLKNAAENIKLGRDISAYKKNTCITIAAVLQKAIVKPMGHFRTFSDISVFSATAGFQFGVFLGVLGVLAVAPAFLPPWPLFH
jgi:hypothetical protein